MTELLELLGTLGRSPDQQRTVEVLLEAGLDVKDIIGRVSDTHSNDIYLRVPGKYEDVLLAITGMGTVMIVHPQPARDIIAKHEGAN